MELRPCFWGLRVSAALHDYQALDPGTGHNSYFGREEADVAKFVEYFTLGMADAFMHVRLRAEEARSGGSIDQSAALRELSALQREALGLFSQSRTIAAKELAVFLGIAERKASELCRRWVRDGFLQLADPSKKARRYRLVKRFERLIC